MRDFISNYGELISDYGTECFIFHYNKPHELLKAPGSKSLTWRVSRQPVGLIDRTCVQGVSKIDRWGPPKSGQITVNYLVSQWNYTTKVNLQRRNERVECVCVCVCVRPKRSMRDNSRIKPRTHIASAAINNSKAINNLISSVRTGSNVIHLPMPNWTELMILTFSNAPESNRAKEDRQSSAPQNKWARMIVAKTHTDIRHTYIYIYIRTFIPVWRSKLGRKR